MEVLEKFGIKINGLPFVTAIASSVAIGKTTVLVSIASELIKQDKNVLYVSDTNSSNILRKILNLVGDKTIGKLRVYSGYEINAIEKIIQGNNFEYVIIDSYIFSENSDFYFMFNFFRNKNISTFVSIQTNRKFKDGEIEFSSRKLGQSVDYVFGLTRKEKITFFQKIKYWFKREKAPNFKLNMLKNRFGKNNKNYEFYVDINKLNKL